MSSDPSDSAEARLARLSLNNDKKLGTDGVVDSLQLTTVEAAIRAIFNASGDGKNEAFNDFCDKRELEIFSLNPSAAYLSLQDLVRLKIRYHFPVSYLPMFRQKESKFNGSDVWCLTRDDHAYSVDSYTREKMGQGVVHASFSTGITHVHSHADKNNSISLLSAWRTLHPNTAPSVGAQQVTFQHDVVWEEKNQTIIRDWLAYAYVASSMWFDCEVGQWDDSEPPLFAHNRLIMHVEDPLKPVGVLLPFDHSANIVVDTYIRQDQLALRVLDNIRHTPTPNAAMSNGRRSVVHQLLNIKPNDEAEYTAAVCDEWIDLSWSTVGALHFHMYRFGSTEFDKTLQSRTVAHIIGNDVKFFDNWLHKRMLFLDHPSFYPFYVMCRVVEWWYGARTTKELMTDMNITLSDANKTFKEEIGYFNADRRGFRDNNLVRLEKYILTAAFIFFYKVMISIDQTLQSKQLAPVQITHLTQIHTMAFDFCSSFANKIKQDFIYNQVPINAKQDVRTWEGFKKSDGKSQLLIPMHLMVTRGQTDQALEPLRTKNNDKLKLFYTAIATAHLCWLSRVKEQLEQDSEKPWMNHNNDALLYMDPTCLTSHTHTVPLYRKTSQAWLPDNDGMFRMEINVLLRRIKQTNYWVDAYDQTSVFRDVLVTAIRAFMENPESNPFQDVREKMNVLSSGSQSVMKKWWFFFTGDKRSYDDTSSQTQYDWILNLLTTFLESVKVDYKKYPTTSPNAPSWQTVDAEHQSFTAMYDRIGEQQLYKFFQKPLPVHLGNIKLYVQCDEYGHNQPVYAIPYRLYFDQHKTFVCHVVLDIKNSPVTIIQFITFLCSEPIVRLMSASMSLYLNEEAETRRLLYTTSKFAPPEATRPHLDPTWITQRLGLYWRRVLANTNELREDIKRSLDAIVQFSPGDAPPFPKSDILDIFELIEAQLEEFEYGSTGIRVATILCQSD